MNIFWVFTYWTFRQQRLDNRKTQETRGCDSGAGGCDVDGGGIRNGACLCSYYLRRDIFKKMFLKITISLLVTYARWVPYTRYFGWQNYWARVSFIMHT